MIVIFLVSICILSILLVMFAAIAGSWSLIFTGALLFIGSLYVSVILTAQKFVSDEEAAEEHEDLQKYTTGECLFLYKVKGRRVILEDGQVTGFSKEA